jgi:hypothetical protein
VTDAAGFKHNRLRYLTGLIDGDGSFSIRFDSRAGYQLTTCVYSTFRPLMKWLVGQFGGAFRKMSTVGNRKQKYQWYTSSLPLALAVAPHLLLKAEQGKIVRTYVSLGSERLPGVRQKLMDALSEANTFYVPVEKIHLRATIDPTKLDFAYLAGLFDAEGSFTIHEHKYRGNGRFTSIARISNTDQRIFPWLMTRFGGYMNAGERDGKTEGTWILSGKNREPHVLAMLPYLVIKKERAIVYLEWIRHCRKLSLERKRELTRKMMVLNHRGLSPEANTSSAAARRRR